MGCIVYSYKYRHGSNKLRCIQIQTRIWRAAWYTDTDLMSCVVYRHRHRHGCRHRYRHGCKHRCRHRYRHRYRHGCSAEQMG